MKNSTKMTIKNIADLAGVSIATVSRVMNHQDTVKEDTRRKIIEAMKKFNLNPSSVLLTNSKSHTILLCTRELNNPFNSLTIRGIQQAANRNNYRVLIIQSQGTYFTFEDFKDILQAYSVAGIILLSSIAKPELMETLSLSCPIVVCSEHCDINGISFVCVDDVSAAREATEYLLTLGCKKIALINTSLEYQFARNRELGYTQALKNYGLKKKEEWIIHLPSIDFNIAVSYVSNLLVLPNRPDAFFAVSDVYAVAAIHAIKRVGLRIPEDISVIGFDNIEMSSMTDPPITTIEQPGVKIGYQSCELVIEKINNFLTSKKQIIVDTELIVRESTRRSSNSIHISENNNAKKTRR